MILKLKYCFTDNGNLSNNCSCCYTVRNSLQSYNIFLITQSLNFIPKFFVPYMPSCLKCSFRVAPCRVTGSLS